MNLRDVECFFAVADELHFARAAENLHLSQPSVSEAVTRLERTLGASLFRRTSRRVEITALGEKFLADARPAYDALLNAHQTAAAFAQRRGELQIGHTPELGHLIFPRLIERIGAGRSGPVPSWKPTLLHTHEQLAAVSSGDIDMGVCWQPTVSLPLMSTVLARCPFVAIMRGDDPLTQVGNLQLRDLRGRQLVVSRRADNRFIDARVEAALLAAGIAVKSLNEVSRYDELAVNVACRSVIGVHPATIAQFNRMPGLIFRELNDSGMHLNIAVVSRQNSDLPPSFVELLRLVTLEALDEILSRLNFG